jgi:hypothetical protein
MNIIKIILLIWLGLFNNVFAQIKYDFNFANYLINEKLNGQVKDYLQLSLKAADVHQKDTILHQLIELYFTEKKIDSSIVYYHQLSELNQKDKFQLAFCFVYKNEFDSARQTLALIDTTDVLINDLKYIYQASTFILEKKTSKSDSVLALIKNKDSYLLSLVYENLGVISVKAKQVKCKSSFIGGGLSAFIPGLGKAYAKKPYEGLSGFLQTSVLGYLAFENYRLAGLNSGRFYFFGTVFGLFYVGNIWGSALAANRYSSLMKKKLKDEVIVNMHLALRNYFRY